MSDEDHPQIIKFDPPAHVRLLGPDDLVLDVPTLLWDALAPGTRAAIPSPWQEGQFLIGQVGGKPGQLLLVVGESFGALEHDKEEGWLCTGIVQQRQIWNAVGTDLAEKSKGGSFTKRLTKRAAKSSSK